MASLNSKGTVMGADRRAQEFRLGVIDRRLTPSRLVASTAGKQLSSVADLAVWVHGAANRVTVTNNGDGTITIDMAEAGVDHGALAPGSLDDDDHPQYALLVGRIGDVWRLLTATAPAAAANAVGVYANDQQSRAGDHAFHIVPEAAGRGYSFGTQAQIGGGLVLPVATKTANYNISLSDHTVLADSASPITFTLPAAASAYNSAIGAGQEYHIKNIGAGLLTVDANGSETIDGAASQVLGAWDAVTVRCNGAAWFIV